MAQPTPGAFDNRSEPPVLEQDPTLEAYVDGVIQSWMAGQQIPGVTLAIVADGEVSLLKGYGYANLESKTPVDPERSMFRIGSIAKTLTWTAVMQLEEQGKLDLDTDVNQYLQSLQVPGGYEQPITLRHLMHHRPGFEDGGLGYLFYNDPDAIPTMQVFLADHMPNRVRAPGSQGAYSNYGTVLAGQVIEDVSGIPFGEYMQTRLFDPLGMTNATYGEPLDGSRPTDISAERAANIATGYLYSEGRNLPQPLDLISHIAPAGSLSISAGDMARYMLAHLGKGAYNGAQILQPDSVMRMRQRGYSDNQGIPDYAHGFVNFRLGNHETYEHSGGTTTFYSHLMLIPDAGIGIFYSANSTQADEDTREPALRIAEHMLGLEPALPLEVTSTPDLAPYAGTYLYNQRSFTTLEKVAGLAYAIDVTPGPEGYLMVSALGESSSWVAVEDDIFERTEGGVRLRFEANANGEFDTLYLGVGNGSFARIGWRQSPGFLFTGLALSAVLSLLVLCRFLVAPGVGGWWRASALFSSATGVVLTGCFTLAILGLLGAGDELLFEWPPAPLKWTVYLAWLGIPAAVAGALALPAAWSRTGVRASTRVLFTLHLLALVMLLAGLYEWNVLTWRMN